MKKGDIVIAPEGCGDYLTAGKEYQVLSVIGQESKSGVLFMIMSDNGYEVWSTKRESSHLNMGNWILKPNK